MKYITILSAFAFLFTFQIKLTAQNVGIGTENPQTTLDVAGDLNVSGSIHLGETPGTAGQFITSQGPNDKPKWEIIQLPAGLGDSFTLSYMDSFIDAAGQEFTSTSAGHTSPYELNDPMNATVGWTELPGLSNNVTIYRSVNKVNLHLQTIAQLSGTPSAGFACGFFINDTADKTVFRLKGVRTDVVREPSGSYKMFNMNTTIENLAPGEYTIKTACIRRNIAPTATLGIGRALNSNALSSSMAQSTLNVYTLEKY